MKVGNFLFCNLNKYCLIFLVFFFGINIIKKIDYFIYIDVIVFLIVDIFFDGVL